MFIASFYARLDSMSKLFASTERAANSARRIFEIALTHLTGSEGPDEFSLQRRLVIGRMRRGFSCDRFALRVFGATNVRVSSWDLGRLDPFRDPSPCRRVAPGTTNVFPLETGSLDFDDGGRPPGIVEFHIGR